VEKKQIRYPNRTPFMRELNYAGTIPAISWIPLGKTFRESENQAESGDRSEKTKNRGQTHN